ncbi:hypothetical protein M747DRAFT_297567 [Aspergillus niger ATCC 13496]|uniref:Uncharacterized protein n=1 Tax=Aspergillus niger ATCC 13496 TaxID=1353008 RepID=A0A370BQN3_ASPNG|nr:hypothetical protein M747DRAFT_297567 [Aspergillus niger ATCC 13496]
MTTNPTRRRWEANHPHPHPTLTKVPTISHFSSFCPALPMNSSLAAAGRKTRSKEKEAADKEEKK